MRFGTVDIRVAGSVSIPFILLKWVFLSLLDIGMDSSI